MRIIGVILAAVLWWPSLIQAAGTLTVSADGSLVLSAGNSRSGSGDTLSDVQTLEGQVHAYIFQNKTRVWTPNSYSVKSTPYPIRAFSSWKPLSNPRLESLISKYAQKNGVEPSLVRAVMRHESGFNAQAVSPKGALGLMQLMPGTAALMGVRNPFDPEENIAGGVGYLRLCLNRFQNNIALAVAAYNAGPERVARCAGVPPIPETQVFVSNVMGSYTGNNPSAAKPAAPPAPARGAGPAPKTIRKIPAQVKLVENAAPRPPGPKIIEVRPRKTAKRLPPQEEE
jgi:hypothetical protein